MPGQRAILLIEDEAIVRRYLTQLLEKQSWNVTGVRSGNEALTTLAVSRFDIILCDLDLGAGINGIEVLHRMPRPSVGTPFVILTGHGTIDRYRDAIERGATDFLEKPITEWRLLSSLNRAMGVGGSSAGASGSDEPVWRESVADKHLRSALRTIESECANPDFSVHALAKSIAVTPDHLARLFRARLGRAPLEQIHRTRISQAEKLLNESTVSVYEVATDCGYRTTTELDAWFRHFNQMTPTEWRGRTR
jgi:two-component system response regulator YesN